MPTALHSVLVSHSSLSSDMLESAQHIHSLPASGNDDDNVRPGFLMPRAYWIPLAAWAIVVALAMLGYFVQLINTNIASGQALRQSWSAERALSPSHATVVAYDATQDTLWESDADAHRLDTTSSPRAAQQ